MREKWLTSNIIIYLNYHCGCSIIGCMGDICQLVIEKWCHLVKQNCGICKGFLISCFHFTVMFKIQNWKTECVKAGWHFFLLLFPADLLDEIKPIYVSAEECVRARLDTYRLRAEREGVGAKANIRANKTTNRKWRLRAGESPLHSSESAERLNLGFPVYCNENVSVIDKTIIVCDLVLCCYRQHKLGSIYTLCGTPVMEFYTTVLL